MSAYDGHDDYDREFERPATRATALGVVGWVCDALFTGMAGLVAGRWTWLAMGPQREWGSVIALVFAMGGAVFGAGLTLVVLARTRDAELPLRLGLRFAIVAVFLVVFGLATVRSGG